MKKTIIEEVLKRSGGVCELCGSNDRVELHHIISGIGKRTQHESTLSVMALCYQHHRGTRGVHGRDGDPLNKNLKKMLQGLYFSQGLPEEKVREMMGGNLY